MKHHLKYLRYLLRHKWFVFVAGLRIGSVPLWRLVVHDWSKFMFCEWLPYARRFYADLPTWSEAKIQCPGYSWEQTKEGVEVAFDRAWLHHQHFNPHHWQHWVLREDDGQTKYLEMPKRLAYEMVADWCGAGRAITGKWEVWTWYFKNRERILLHENTRAVVETLILIEQAEFEGVLGMGGER